MGCAVVAEQQKPAGLADDRSFAAAEVCPGEQQWFAVLDYASPGPCPRYSEKTLLTWWRNSGCRSQVLLSGAGSVFNFVLLFFPGTRSVDRRIERKTK